MLPSSETPHVQRVFDFDSLEVENRAIDAVHDSSVSFGLGSRDLCDYQNAGTDELVSYVLPEAVEYARSLRDLELQAFPELTLEELSEISPRFSGRDLATLLAAVELGRRVAEAKLVPCKSTPLSSTTAATQFCKQHFSRLIQDGIQEEFHVLTLDTKNRFKRSHLVTIGTLDASLVHPREVFRPAIKDSASSIIAVHNHPSGDPTPSREDHEVTRRLEQCGKTLGISVLDHIIVAKRGVLSIREA